MTRDEAAAQINLILGFSSGLASTIATNIQQQQQELEHEPTLPYFLREEVTNLVSVADNPSMAAPTGFLRPWEEDDLMVQDEDGLWQEVERDDPKYLRSVYGIETGMPKAYSWDSISPTFKLYPTPDAVYIFRMSYYKADTVLAAGGDTNKWLTHMPYLLIGRAGIIIATAKRDTNAMSVFSQYIQSETLKLNALTTDRDTSRRIVMGGDD